MRLRRDVEERGTVALRLGLIDESEQYFRDSLERSQREEWHSESGISLLGLADIAASRGNADEAMTHLDRAEEAFALTGDEAYRRQVTAKRATLEAAADAEAAQPRANTAASIGPGLAGVLEQHSADEAGETPVR